MKSLKHLIYIVLIVTFLVIPAILIAQPPPDPCPDPLAMDCPIDSAVILLILGAVAIAAKKAYDYTQTVKAGAC